MTQSELQYDPSTRELSWQDAEEKALVPTQEGLLDTNWDLGWWQQHLQPRQVGRNETVEACVRVFSQTVSMCPITHFQDNPDGEAVRQYGSWVERVLNNPNPYTTRSLFFNNLIRSLYFYGNGYAVATRDGNGAISNLYLVDPRNMQGMIDPETGEPFYWFSPRFASRFNPDTDTVYLPRDVLNVRINIDIDEPLKGLTPIHANAKSIAANNAITAHQAHFFNNMSRPSGLLSTPDPLDLEQLTQLRKAFNDATSGVNSGQVPILAHGLKWDSMSLTSQDAQMVEAFNMSVRTISGVFGVPLAMINDMSAATFTNAEAMNSWFLSSSLGFLLDHIELELNRLFSLDFGQRTNFDVVALLRTDSKTQMETLKTGVTGGIMSTNEARKSLKLAPVEFGDEPRVQQQMVPLSAYDQMPEPAPAPALEEPAPVEASVADLLTKGFADAG